MMRVLLATPGVSANAASSSGDTPLLFAASRSQLGAAALLAKVRASVMGSRNQKINRMRRRTSTVMDACTTSTA